MPNCSVLGVSRLLAASAGLALAAPCLAQTIYFCDLPPGDGVIRKVNADGSGLQDVLPVGFGLLSLDVDATAGKIYFTDWSANAIRKCNLDGSSPQDVSVGPSIQYPAVLRLNPPTNQLIWGDQTNGEIDWDFFTGGGPFILATTPFHRGLFIDTASQQMWWSTDVTSTAGNIVRATTGGDGQTIVVTGAGKPAAVAVDAAGGKIYWTDYVTQTVRRSNLDGSGIQTLYSDPSGHSPRGIALDLVAGKLYWGQDTGDESPSAEILRTNLDGTGFEVVTSSVTAVQDLRIVRGGGPCYPNCDNSTTSPILNVQDFSCFLTRYASGDAYANCDGSTQPPVLNVQDFSCFLTKYAAGCR